MPLGETGAAGGGWCRWGRLVPLGENDRGSIADVISTLVRLRCIRVNRLTWHWNADVVIAGATRHNVGGLHAEQVKRDNGQIA